MKFLNVFHKQYPIFSMFILLAFTPSVYSQVSPEQSIQQLGFSIPSPTTPVANYVNAVTSGNLVFLAGKGPVDTSGNLIKGKLGKTMSVEQGYLAAQSAGLQLLTALKAEIGDLSRVVRIVKVTGMVNATSDFTQHPEVINGFSDLMVKVFGDKGKHARAAVGMNSLPRGMAVEIEMIVEIQD